MRPGFPPPLAILVAAGTFMACTPMRAQPPATPTTHAHEAVAAGADHVPADVHFMQGMIGHHRQAVVMAAMAPTHGASERLRLFAHKIDLSQRDEMAFMVRWLEDRHLAVPDEHARMEMRMPGMLTDEQMQRLDGARGAEFDRLFLTYMIQHHRGALTMVGTLFDAPGGAQEPELFRFVSDVDADQRGEIDVMQQMLNAIPTPRSPAP